MKRILSVVLAITLIITSISPTVYTSAGTQSGSNPTTGIGEIPINLKDKKEERAFEYEFLPVSNNWRKFVGTQEPATFPNVTYELAEDVIEIDKTVTDQLASAAQLYTKSTERKKSPNQMLREGCYIPVNELEKATAGTDVKPGTVFVDVGTATAFKVVAPVEYSETTEVFKDTYSVVQPELHEIVSNFNIPEDTIELNRANISGFAENVEKNVVKPNKLSLTADDSFNSFKYLKDPLIQLKFPKDTELVGYEGDGNSLTVIVNGGLGIGDLNLTGRYSGFDGYRIGLNFKQESYLSVEIATTITSEIRVPIFGLDVPFGIGRVAGGVFIVIDMDGNLRLEIQAREFTENTIGIKGKTAFYVPCTYRPMFENNDSKFEGDVNLLGQINGVIKAGALLEIEIFGLNLVGAGAFVGAGVYVEKDGKNLNIELYALLQANLTFMGKRFNLVNWHLTIFEKKQRDTGGFKVEIVEAFLSPLRVGGYIKGPAENGFDYIPMKDMDYRIKIIPEDVDPDSQSDKIRYYPKPDGKNNPIYDKTNAEGEFYRDDVQIMFNDRVCIEFRDNKGNVYECDTVNPTLPFEKITILKADYFNDYVTGQVEPVTVINWAATPDSPPMEQQETIYYNGMVTVTPSNSANQGFAMTDRNGYFNTAEGIKITDTVTMDNNMNIYPDTHIYASIDAGGFLLTESSWITPSVEFEVFKVKDELENSYEQYEEGDKVIDRMAYNEYLWIVNLGGTKVLTESQVQYEVYGFSQQDKWTRLYGYNQYSDDWSAKGLVPTPPVANVKSELDENGDATGAVRLSHNIITEWVWQPHKNPTKIISDDNTALDKKGGSFQVEATGNPALVYSLQKAPAGVIINKDTGVITIPAGMLIGTYNFIIQVEQWQNPSYLYLGKFKKYEEDPSPPAEQNFMLRIVEEMEEEPTPEPTTSPTPTKASDPMMTQTPQVTEAPSKVPTVTPGATPTPAIKPRVTSTPTPTPKPPSTPTPTPEPTPTPRPTSTPTPTPEPTPTTTPTPTATPTPIPIRRMAPVFAVEEHNYEFTKLVNGGNLTIPITVNGSEPITYSLTTTSARYSIPREVTIDEETGTITVNDRITAGTYYFTAVATNNYGTAKQSIKLTVTSLQFKPPVIRSMNIEGNNGLISLSTSKTQPMDMAQFSKLSTDVEAIKQFTMEPLPQVVIRNDHKSDLYSKKQFNTNGSAYVLWDNVVTITIEGKSSIYVLEDSTPLTDHHLRELEPFQKDELDKQLQELVTDFNKQNLVWGEHFDTNQIGELGMDTSSFEYGGELFVFDYGSVLGKMDSNKGGAFDIKLGGNTGTFVTGKLFTGLQKYEDGSLSLLQEGATITFTGKDITSADETKIYNFGYSPEAPGKAAMLSSLSSGADSFTYSFAHHGELPGMATFAITTDIEKGTKVNVYKFDSATNIFLLVADGLTVDAKGVVTYQNNTMSEYLITTEDIDGAAVAETIALQTVTKQKTGIILFLIGFITVLFGVVAYVIIHKRKRRL